MRLLTRHLWPIAFTILTLGTGGAAWSQLATPAYHAPRHIYPNKQFPTQIRVEPGTVRITQMRNITKMSLATLEYAQDTPHMTYPNMSNATTVKKALWPYLKKNAAFVDPVTHLAYRPNPYLSGKPLLAQADGNKMVLFYEARPAKDGTRAVTFADGHSAPILEREWPRLKRMSHIP